MRKLILFEYYKLFQKKVIWCFLLLCVIVNVLSVYYRIEHVPENSVYSLSHLSTMYERYQPEKLDSQTLREKQLQMSQYLFGNGNTITQRQTREFLMLSFLCEQSENLDTYDAYLENIEIQAEERLQSSLFAQPGTFSYRNLQKMPQAYRFLEDVRIVQDFDGGILLFAQNRLTDALLVIIALLFLMQIFVSERENGTWSLIKSMKQGHAALLSAKLIAAFFTVIGLSLLFYGINYLMISKSIGFGDTSRALQSVDGYFTSVFPLSVHQYLLCIVPVKILGLLALGSLFVLLCMLTRSSIFAGITGVCIFAAELVLWYTIYESSYLGPLKYLNLALLLLPDTVFAGYGTVNFFSYPMSNLIGALLMFLFCFAAGILGSFLLYENESVLTLRRRRNRLRISKKRNTQNVRNIWFYEFYKQAVIGKGAVLFAVFLCVQVCLFFSSHYFIVSDEFYYRTYSEVLSGPFSVEKEEYLADEAARFQELQDEKLEIIERYNNGEIDAMKQAFLIDQIPFNQSQFNALGNVTTQYEMLKSLHDNDGLEVEYIYLSPWEKLLGTDAQKSYALKLEIAFVFLLFILSSSGAIEKNASMDKLIAVSVAGKKGIAIRKLTLYLLLATVIALCAFLPELFKIVQVYGLDGFSAPAASYFLKTVFPPGMTLGGCLIAEYVGLYLLILAMTTITFLISEKVGNRIVTLLTGTAVFLLPTLMYLLTA